MSWQPDSPVELSNGMLVCNRHRRDFCHECCLDYSFWREAPLLEEEDHNYAAMGASASYGVTTDPREQLLALSRCFCFNPPNTTDTPSTLFHSSSSLRCAGYRFVRVSKPDQILIYTDGACIRNGQDNPAAGCAFVFGPHLEQAGTLISPFAVKFRLELQGPTGVHRPQTSNRAELRAVIGALQYCAWDHEGWSELIIATDSEYVARGATQWAQDWVRNGWKTIQGADVKNRDLWEVLLEEIQRLSSWDNHKCRVGFWRIPRGLNTVADRHARLAAEMPQAERYTKICGGLV